MDKYDDDYCAQLAYVQSMVQAILDTTKQPSAEADALDAVLEFIANERDAKGDQS